MRKIGLLLVIVLLISVLGGCGPSSADILAQYKDNAAADSAANKAGITIGKVELVVDSYYIISVLASHPAINQSKDNAGVLAGRLQVVDAEKPDTEVDHQIASVNSTTTRADGTSTQEFYPAVRIEKNIRTKFIIIYFEGISSDETPELETQPLFFIVELDKKEPKVLTEKALLAGDLFK